VDSAVAALLIHRAIGAQLDCVFVDNGLLRRDEARRVAETFGPRYGLNVRHVDAADQFLRELAGVADPEAKVLEAQVADDQLKLAIGKKGINVRLASKLVGWSINIEKALPKEESKTKEKVKIETPKKDQKTKKETKKKANPPKPPKTLKTPKIRINKDK
jgi:outer membrane biosynthesis protein TonB